VREETTTKEMTMTTAMHEMTTTDLMREARRYDNLHNEGGDGYNPYRVEMSRRDHEAEANRPRTRDDVVQEILRLDCEIARESGTLNEARIAELRAELKAMDDAADAKMLQAWPLAVTVARRAAWNDMVRSGKFGSGKLDLRAVQRQEQEQGWTMGQLKRAVELHKRMGGIQ
jgi:hypothetical protein